MKIVIVGSGAVGLYYGARLSRSGQDVHFLAWSDFEEIRKNGIAVESPDGDFKLTDVPVYLDPQDIGECDLVIVALKATANGDLARLLEPLVTGSTRLLALQNGLGSDRLLAELYEAARVLGGLCFVCLNRTGAGKVADYHLGSIAVGAYGGAPDSFTHALGALFEESGVRCRVYEDLQLAQWRKLAWNVPLNGLAIVAGGLRTDAILADEGLCSLARELMSEIIDGARALGMAIDRGIIEKQIEITYPMGDYQPSSLIDFTEGRPVEVEAIWGEPYRQAQATSASARRHTLTLCAERKLCVSCRV